MISELFAKYESGAKQYIYIKHTTLAVAPVQYCVRSWTICPYTFIRSNSSRADVSTVTITNYQVKIVLQAIFNSIWLNSNGLKFIRHEW